MTVTLPPSHIVIETPAPGLVDGLDGAAFDPPALHDVHLRARRLKLLQGFQELLCLPVLRNVDPYAHQTDTALRALRRYQGRALLCDEVGLGKTIEAGMVFKEYVLRGLVKKALVLTPPGLTEQWAEEMSSKFGLACVGPDDEVFLQAGGWEGAPFVVASMSLARRSPHAEAITRLHYDLVIVDEAHRLRNRASVSWKFVNALDKKYLLLLTATPVQNDLEELYNLVTLLKPGQLGAPKDFKGRFVERGDPRSPKNAEALRGLLADCMVRNTRAQLDRRLPPRRAYTTRVALTAPERALYDRVTARLKDAAAGGKSLSRMLLNTLQKELGSSPAAFAATARSLADRPAASARQGLSEEWRAFFREAAGEAEVIKETAKSRALAALLSALPSSEKALVFTGYRRTLEDMRAFLEARGLRVAVYHGGLSRAEKEEAVRSFEGEVPVLLSTEAGGEGRNLQFCRTLVNLDLPYNPMKIEQRAGRIHRIGQTEPVTIHNLAAENTLEEALIRLLDEKIHMFELVVGEMDMILGELEEEGDFEDMLLDLWWKSRSPEEWSGSVNALGDRMLEAKRRYLQAQDLDQAVFGRDFEAT